ncbi:reticulon-like protein B21 isoform X1 [Cucumis melo var. makuwa]|uniref:Reticulon-like protein n=1 Tax=Cucumis melo var. makuwa TaxID=1194695 RepID=A0A5A7V8P0_CUCMM|nr:reticulon-like protein B21 isoform X1 [Cucumis melo var. makuwa]TYJ97890.1 reticulon-like protein B21 isoform X1 [Cucumis melo var. makuwa]
MDLSRRRAAVAARGNVVAGSVWESRIRFDEVRGGIKVFNGDDENAECGVPTTAASAAAGGSGRRKTWKSDEGFNPILIAEEKPESSPSSGDEQSRKSPTPSRRLRSNGSPNKPVQVSGEKTERNSTRKKTDQSRKSVVALTKPPTNGIGKTSSEKSFKELNECKEKVISSSTSQDFFDAFEEEIEKESFDVKEINLPERKKIIAQTFPGNKQKLQTLMDLIMWRDFSRSGLVFGVGNLVIILSCFIKNINISFISLISHMGLLYLTAIFVHSSIFGRRKRIDSDDENFVVEEEDMIRFAKRLVPFVNELLQNLKALFRGDSSATMKVGVLLFVLAKWGSFITLWNVLKIGFIGVFTLPKLITHGEHWLKLCGSSWKLCSHKRGVFVAIFFLVWNFSSTLYRVWAAFIVLVSFRYYQESPERDVWVKNGEVASRNNTVSTSSKLKRQY